MKFDVNKIIVKDLNGNIQPVDLPKALGNTIYSFSRSIEWIEPSKAIYAGEIVELTGEQIRMIQILVSEPYVNLLTMVKEAIVIYINELLIQK